MRTPLIYFQTSALVALALVCAQACGGSAEDVAQAETLEIRGAPLDGPLAPPEDDAATELIIESITGPITQAIPESLSGALLEADTAPPVADATQLYADASASGSVDDRDALAAAALGPEVLAMREAAKDLARDIEAAGERGEFAYIDFERLVFEDYAPPEYRESGEGALARESFPEEIRTLQGQKIELAGFMIAVDFKDKKVEDFMLCRFPPGCCFGGIPLFDEWVDCTPSYDEKRDWSPFEMILVDGTLEVGEVLDEDGFVLSIYRMRVDDIRPFE